MEIYRIIIAGSRNFSDYPKLVEVCDSLFENVNGQIEIVSGSARGADRLGELYARERGYRLRRFPADWDELGKKAGYVRNMVMGGYADMAVIFWDGESRGTKSMIDIMYKLKKYCKVVKV